MLTSHARALSRACTGPMLWNGPDQDTLDPIHSRENNGSRERDRVTTRLGRETCGQSCENSFLLF